MHLFEQNAYLLATDRAYTAQRLPKVTANCVCMLYIYSIHMIGGVNQVIVVAYSLSNPTGSVGFPVCGVNIGPGLASK